MKSIALKNNIETFFKFFGLAVVRHKTLDRYRKYERAVDELEMLLELPRNMAPNVLDIINGYTSQLRQEIFVLTELNFKRNGYFVEFGATNGFNLSNTYILEKKYGWSGILAEPAECWRSELVRNRSALIDTRCVWKVSNDKLTFQEVDYAELSTIKQISTQDGHGAARKNSKEYVVDTVSLNDLLDQHNAPDTIDYLSIDTEGSEYEILMNYDFSKRKIKIITCEHNYTGDRDKIYKLMVNNGYVRKYENLSKWDDWYVLA